MNDQKPLGYVFTAGVHRLQTGGVVEYIHREEPTPKTVGGAFASAPPCRAVFLHPDPDADKLRARIRVLEANQKRVAAWLSEDSGADGAAVLQWLETGDGDPWPDTTREKKLLEDLAHQTAVATRLATEHAAMSATLTEAQNAGREAVEARRKAEQELAAESRKVGEQATEIDRLRATIVDIQDAAKGLPELGALLTAEKVAWAAAEIRKLRAVDAARWLDENCPAGWHVRLHRSEDIGVPNHYEAVAFVLGKKASAPSNHQAREALACSLGWTGGEKATGPIEWLDAHTVGWKVSEEPQNAPTCRFKAMVLEFGYGGTRDEAAERLAKAMGWPGPKTPPSPAETAPVAAPDASGVPRGGSGTPTVPGASPGQQPSPPAGRPFTVALTYGKISDIIEISGSEPFAGKWRRVRDPKPDNCPMPAEVSGWEGSEWERMFDDGKTEWKVTTHRVGSDRHYWVRANGIGQAYAPCKTMEGGLRLGVKAARLAWRIRNGVKL